MSIFDNKSNRFDLVDRQLLHAILTVDLSIYDAARMLHVLRKSRKANLIAMLSFLGLLLVQLILFPVLYLFKVPGIVFYMDNFRLAIPLMVLIGFGSLIACLAAVAGYFGNAGTYYKALRIAYPNLPEVEPANNDEKYTITGGAYIPENYRTDKRDHTLLEKLASGEVAQSRAKGLLNYAIYGCSQSRSYIIFVVIFSAVLLIGSLVILYIPTFNESEIGSFIQIYLILGALILASSIRWILSFRSNNAYIDAIKTGYPSLYDPNGKL
jgi:hypothetical protein